MWQAKQPPSCFPNKSDITAVRIRTNRTIVARWTAECAGSHGPGSCEEQVGPVESFGNDEGEADVAEMNDVIRDVGPWRKGLGLAHVSDMRGRESNMWALLR